MSLGPAVRRSGEAGRVDREGGGEGRGGRGGGVQRV